MKILIVGSDEIWALENAYVSVFKGVTNCRLFNAHGVFLNYLKSSMLNKIKYSLGLSTILNKINKDLLQEVEKNIPDVVFIFKGMEIFPATLRKLRLMGIKLANYNGDHPFEHFSKGSGNKNVTDSVGLYDLHFSYSKKIIALIENEFNIPAKWLPFGYYTAVVPDFSKQLESKVCFIGNPDLERVRVINVLLKNNIKVDVYGSNWDKWKFTNTSYLTTNPPLYKEDFNATAQKYKLNLNIFRPHNAGSHNMRTFEMPALGCILISTESEEHLYLFKKDKEMLFYNSDVDLVEQVRKILSKRDESLQEIRLSAYQRSINSGYSYKERAEYALEELRRLVKN